MTIAVHSPAADRIPQEMCPLQPSSLIVENVRKRHFRGRIIRQSSFELRADFSLIGPNIVGVFGDNGSGKSTLFNIISGRATPSRGRVICGGHDIHRALYSHRGRLVQYRQQRLATHPYLFAGWNPLLARAYESIRRRKPIESLAPAIHLFDEPDFKDEYVELRLNFLHQLREQGGLILLAIHPHGRREAGIIRRLCDSYLFVRNGEVSQMASFDAVLDDEHGRQYLGDAVPIAAG